MRTYEKAEMAFTGYNFTTDDSRKITYNIIGISKESRLKTIKDDS